MATGMSSIATLSAAIEPLTSAALHGEYGLLLTGAERVLERVFPDVTACVVIRAGGIWYESRGAEPGEIQRSALHLPAEIDNLQTVCEFTAGAFVPLLPGAMGLWVQGAVEDVTKATELPLLQQFLAMAVHTCERQRVAVRNLDEVQALQRVATRMLKSHDVDEILLLITQEAKRLLSADICGMLLREGSGLVMKRCVGHSAPATANLRMDAGQGLAGLALARASPAAVEDYVTSDIISSDFMGLAATEQVRSALAAPLIGHGNVIGVLEVWRRRPSVFTSPDTTRLVALANLTTLAIENATLVADQQRMLADLAHANTALNERYDTVSSASTLSNQLTELLLQGASLQTIVGTVATFLQSEASIATLGGAIIASSSDGHIPPGLKKAMGDAGTHPGGTLELTSGDARWHARSMVIEGESFGWAIGRIGARGEALTDLALLQLALLAALREMAQRAASRARAETIETLVWNLLRGDDSARAGAIDRAAELKVDLSGPMRVVLIELDLETPSSVEHSAAALRKLVTTHMATARGPFTRALALQGGSIALLVSDLTPDDLERYVERVAVGLSKAMDDHNVVAGASSRCDAPEHLQTAYREAQIALDVARQMGRSGAVIYDRAGVVGMLLGLRHEAGLQRFLELNFGALLDQDAKVRETLLTTLRVFFDTNCSHQIAAQYLRVHRKTVANRLEKISELTGLDLSTHDDRLVADLALYVHRLLKGTK